MSIYRIKMNGKIYEMEIELIEEGASQKRRKPLVSDEHSPAAVPERPQQAGSDAVKAPFPGIVTEIMVQQGGCVSEGDVVLVLEAMKMENEVCAPKAGRIKALFVAEGQAVAAEAPLFELED